MGRELKRVAMDFNWPLSKPWEGYINQFYRKAQKCVACDGGGYSRTYKILQDRWYGYVPFKPEDRGSVPFTPDNPAIREFAARNVENSPTFYPVLSQHSIEREAKRLCDIFNGQWSHHLNKDDVDALLKADRLYDLTKIFTAGKGWQPKNPPHIPTPQEVNEWSLFGFGHDGINCWTVVKAECDRLGETHLCVVCNGEGRHWLCEEDKTNYENWQRTEPPEGEGYQIWETVTEGSPISPVFATPLELAVYMAAHPWGADKDHETTVEQWLEFINGPGWAPSFIGTNLGVISGVQGVSEFKQNETDSQ